MTLTAATQKQCLTKLNYYFIVQKATWIIPTAQKNLHDYTTDCDTGISCTVTASPREYGAQGTRKHTTGKVTDTYHFSQAQNAYVYAHIT
jgi:hypothetical protein